MLVDDAVGARHGIPHGDGFIGPAFAGSRDRREAFLRHLRRQLQQQTGGQDKWNRAVDDGGAEIIMLDNLTETGDGV